MTRSQNQQNFSFVFFLFVVFAIACGHSNDYRVWDDGVNRLHRFWYLFPLCADGEQIVGGGGGEGHVDVFAYVSYWWPNNIDRWFDLNASAGTVGIGFPLSIFPPKSGASASPFDISFD